MKSLTIALLLAAFAQPLHAQGLTPSDREAFLEKLENIRKEADAKVDARFRAAISAYRSAMASENSALDLYLKCEEKVNFEDMKKKSGDFREWKRRNDDKLSDSGFRNALRQQLRWLVLTLEAASEEPDRDKLAIEAAKVLDTIVSQADQLSDHRDMLQQGVTGTVFARAYDISGVKAEDWPDAPGQVKAIYEQVILPPLRRSDRIPALRAAWTKRMVQESALTEAWSGNPGDKPKSGTRSPASEKFVSDTLPNLQWEAETDLFNAGDQRAAALRMLDHIRKYISHESAPKWAEEFTALLQSEQSAAPAP